MIISAVILIIISAALFTLSFFQFKEKGFLFNNAYLYASEEERKKMNKKPYYRQSGIVFSLLGSIFLLNAVQLLTKLKWIFYIVIAVVILTLVYAVISSVKLEKNKK